MSDMSSGSEKTVSVSGTYGAGGCVIDVRGLHKSFGSKSVLRGIDFKVSKGESVVILGGSGSGKSVFLKCILGLLQASSGEIFINGISSGSVRASDREQFLDSFGMLFQGGALFDSLKVWENVAFRFLHGSRKKPNSAARDLAAETLEKVGLSRDTLDLYPAELSGGMQKRVGLARAISTKPEIIFFDEPTTGLDPMMSSSITYLVRDLVRDMGVTAVTITHDIRSSVVIADRFVVLKDGVVYWSGSNEETVSSDDHYIDQFMRYHRDSVSGDQGAAQ